MTITFDKIIIEVSKSENKYVFKVGNEEINREIDLDNLVKYMDQITWSFALKKEEKDDINRIKKIMKSGVSRGTTKKHYSKYGELLLYGILKERFNSEKFVTKVLLSGDVNSEATGFDCAHISLEDGIKTFWMGESKFHNTDLENLSISRFLKEVHKRAIKLDGPETEFVILPSHTEDTSFLSRDEINETMEFIRNNQKPNGMLVNLNLPILFIINRGKKEFKELVKKYFERLEEQNLELNLNKFNKVQFLLILLPIETVKLLREKIEKKSVYAN